MAANVLLIRGTRTRRLRWLGVLGSALIAVTMVGGTAAAKNVEQERFTQEYEFDNWECGYEMHVAGSESLLLQWRTDPKLADFVFFSSNYHVQETWTTADGRSFSLSANGSFKDIKARSLGGSLYQFTFHEAGQPLVVKDSSGRLVARDRGNITVQVTVDFSDGSENVELRVSGPHPLFGPDLCQVVAPLTGGDSAQYLTPRPIGSTDFPMGFYEYLPPSYSATGDDSPLLLFFNGSGENGDGTAEGLSTLLFAGIPRYINAGGWATDRPFVVLSLQHVETPGAFCTTPDEIDAFIDYAVANYNVDPTRIYLTGLSCGAFGIWEYLAAYQADLKAAAAVPIAGDGRPAWAPDYCGLSSTPLWAFHGALDEVVDPLGSIEPMTALAACPGVPADQAKLTVYPDRDHNSWDPAYAGAFDNDIYSWMLGFTNP